MGIKTAADDPVVFLNDCILRMRILKMENKRETLMEALRSASAEERGKLLAEIGEIDKELNLKRFE
jgi:hypothetical protein